MSGSIELLLGVRLTESGRRLVVNNKLIIHSLVALSSVVCLRESDTLKELYLQYWPEAFTPKYVSLVSPPSYLQILT